MSGEGIARGDFLRGAAAAGVGLGFGLMPGGGAAARQANTTAQRPVVSAFIRGLLGMDMPTLARFMEEAGIDGAEVPVRANLSYIRPEQAAEQLPRLADALDRRGKRIMCVTTDVVSPESPHAETLVKTIARLGIPRYRMGFLRYDLNAPIFPQREALKPSLKALAELNQAHGVLGVYQNHSGAEYVSASLWDYYELIRDLPRQHMGISYDLMHATVEGGLMWRQTWKLAQSHVGYVSAKDFRWAGQDAQRVPLGTGRVDPAMFRQVRADYRGDYSVHVEYVAQNALAENAAAMRRDVEALRRLLAA